MFISARREESGEFRAGSARLHPLSVPSPTEREVGADVVDQLPNTCKLSPDNPNLLPVIESSVYIKRLFQFKR